MAERNAAALDTLFAEETVFVQPGAALSPCEELATTAIPLNRIRLVAVVDVNEVVDPFNVTEVCVGLDGAWTLASLSFTRLLTPQ